MKRYIAFALCAVCGFAAFAVPLDHWEINGSSMTDGEWTFTCGRDTNNKVAGGAGEYYFSVKGCTGYPEAVSTLDFSKPLVNLTDGDSRTYAITSIVPEFNGSEAGQRVGVLKLPTHGYNFNLGNQYGGGHAFQDCTNLVSVVPFLPDSCHAIGEWCFSGCTKLSTPLVIRNQTLFSTGESHWGVFENTAIPSADLSGSKICHPSRLFFGNCKKLEWVKFPASLKNFYTGVCPFSGCISLRRVDFHSVPATLNVFGGCNALSEIHFYDCSPTNLTAKSVYSSAAPMRTLSTYIHLDDSKTEELAAWAALTQGGELNATSTWSSASVASSIDYLNRPLRRAIDLSVYHIGVEAITDADEGTGAVGGFKFFRGEDDADDVAVSVSVDIGGTAVNGRTYRQIYTPVQIPAGKKSVNVLIHPLFDEQLSGDSTVTLTLGGSESTPIEGKTTATVNIKKGSSFGGWRLIDGSLMTDGDWTFQVSRRGSYNSRTPNTLDLWVQKCTVWPAEPMLLDFAKTIRDDTSNGENFEISQIDGPLGSTGSFTDAAVQVKELRLPVLGRTFSIAGDMFAGCTNLVNIVPFLPATCVSLGRGVFQSCYSLTNALVFYGAKFGSGIGAWNMCMYCYKIPSADFSESTIPSLYREAFVSCTGLKWVKLPPTCTELGAPTSGNSLSDRTPFGGAGQNLKLIITGEAPPTHNFGLNTVGAIEFTDALNTLPDGAISKYRNSNASPSTLLNSITFVGPPPANLGSDLFTGFTNNSITNYVPYEYANEWRAIADGQAITRKSGSWTSGTTQQIRLYWLGPHGFSIFIK